MKKIILLVLCAFMLSGCSVQKKNERSVFSMDTHIKMTVYGNNTESVLDDAEAEIKRINNKFGIKSIEKTLSESDSETAELLKKAQNIKDKTRGAFDINIAPIMQIWGFYSDEFSKKNYRVPTQKEIDDALLVVKNGEQIDLGGIAKGYCADRVTALLKESGIKSAVLSFGGNISLIGKNPEDKEWAVGIQNPFGDGIYATVYACDTAVVTSGDYVRYFEQNDKKYHHIINPQTGYPAENDLTSVTVIAESGTYADALSTALFVMGREKAINYWCDCGDFEMVLITKDGKIYYTENVNIHTDKEKIRLSMTA